MPTSYERTTPHDPVRRRLNPITSWRAFILLKQLPLLDASASSFGSMRSFMLCLALWAERSNEGAPASERHNLHKPGAKMS